MSRVNIGDFATLYHLHHPPRRIAECQYRYHGPIWQDTGGYERRGRAVQARQRLAGTGAAQCELQPAQQSDQLLGPVEQKDYVFDVAGMYNLSDSAQWPRAARPYRQLQRHEDPCAGEIPSRAYSKTSMVWLPATCALPDLPTISSTGRVQLRDGQLARKLYQRIIQNTVCHFRVQGRPYQFWQLRHQGRIRQYRKPEQGHIDGTVALTTSTLILP